MIGVRFIHRYPIAKTLLSVFFFVLLSGRMSAKPPGELAGFRDIQIRSERIVTAWLGYESSTDTRLLKNTSLYTVSSEDDGDYTEGIHPLAIYRFARGSNSYGWGSADHVDNLLHCVMPVAFKPGKMYVMALGNGLIPARYQQTMEFSLDRTPNPSFKVNQVGYSGRSKTKLIYLSSYLGDGPPVDLSSFRTFELKRKADSRTVFMGSVEFLTDKDPQGGDVLYKLDISQLKEDGEFYVWIDGLGRSFCFLNGHDAAREIFRVICKGMYYQRCGTSIDQPYAEQWPRAMAHDRIYVTIRNIVHPWTEGHGDRVIDPGNPAAGDWYVPDGPLEIHGGHYDAGDFDLRLTHVGVGEKLMSLYESLPERFYDGQVNIPEAGNGIPDILDEAAWSLQQWEYCQDYAREVRGLDGGVAPGMESYRHPPVVRGTGDTDPLPYWMRKVTPYSSFAAAGLFAQAARVFLPFAAERADRYLERAGEAYHYAITHRGESWDPEISYIGAEESYDQTLLNRALCWAAGQLFSTTGEKSYFDDFLSGYASSDGDVFWNFDKWIILWPLISTRQSAVKSVQGELRNQLVLEADMRVSEIEKNGRTGYLAACPNDGGWGSASPLHTRNISPVLRAYLLTKKQKYLDAVATSIDFVLGMNPSEFSWMTGAGTVYAMDPLNINCKYDGVDDPYPGIVIFGPTSNYDNEHNILYPEKSEMGFYRRIADIWSFVEGCEYVVDQQQAGMVMAAGILLPDWTENFPDPSGSSSDMRLSNFPNPFCDMTNIPIAVRKTGRVTVRIYNIRGQEIATLADREYNSGYYTVRWQGTDRSGEPVANGVYLCEIKTGDVDDLTKIILLR